MGGFETLTTRTHREINEERVKRGMSPIEFGDDAPTQLEASTSTITASRTCGCGCGAALSGANSWKFLKGHKPEHLKYKPKNPRTNGRAPKVSNVQSDSLSPVISVLDQQIASLNQRLLKLREARQVLQGL